MLLPSDQRTELDLAGPNLEETLHKNGIQDSRSGIRRGLRMTSGGPRINFKIAMSNRTRA